MISVLKILSTPRSTSLGGALQTFTMYNFVYMNKFLSLMLNEENATPICILLFSLVPNIVKKINECREERLVNHDTR